MSLVYRGVTATASPGATGASASPYFYVATGNASGQGAFSLSFRDTAVAYFQGATAIDAAGPPVNASALDALAARFGSDFRDWMKFSEDITFGGICAVRAVGLYDEIIWDYLARGARTRAFTPPVPESARELGHWDAAAAAQFPDEPFPCIHYYGPPNMTLYRVCLQDGRLISRPG